MKQTLWPFKLFKIFTCPESDLWPFSDQSKISLNTVPAAKIRLSKCELMNLAQYLNFKVKKLKEMNGKQILTHVNLVPNHTRVRLTSKRISKYLNTITFAR